MRVALVENSGNLFGGGQHSFLQLLGAFSQAIEPLVVVPAWGSFADAAAQRARVVVVPMPSLRNSAPFGWIHAGIRLAAVFRRHGIELVHANGSRCMLYAGTVARLCGLPVVWHVRINDPDPALDWLLQRLASTVVVNSCFVAKRFPGFQTEVIPNGVDLALFRPRTPRPELAAELGLGPHERIVLNVARCVAFKGLDRFIEVARRVVRRMPMTRFLLAGEGPLLEELQRQAADLGDRILFLGARRDVPELMALADVVLFTSLEEPFGRVVIEAMAMGIPVVAFASGGVMETVLPGETGLLVDPDDLESMAEAVLGLLSSPVERRRLGEHGQRVARRDYDIRLHARRIEALYDRCR
ncbi:MAG: hypothetical protein A2284_12215 [Deltaproteobacteria bacterium RIFOXYA12_FULL_61_11]|nr:MAG: hypothetical protein A2284_12215 [Deltaproteobacteria bacterium RIFOXYA12_FULL_61_11]